MIRLAVRRPLSTLVATATLVVLGAVSLFRLPVSLLPSLERPRLEIEVETPGLAREEVIRRVTEPLERRLLSLPGVTSIHSTSGDGRARFALETEWQTDPDRLRIDAERRLSGLEEVEIGSLEVEMATGDPSPIVEVAVLGGDSGGQRTAFADDLLVPELARLPGAGRVEVVGRSPLHVVVTPRSAALAARGLTAGDLLLRLAAVGATHPAGRARDGAVVRPLVVREEVRSLDELRALHLDGDRGGGVVGDVADLDVTERRALDRARVDGEEAVLVRVFRAPEANAVALARAVRVRVAELAARAAGVRLAVVSDRSREVVGALAELALAALAGLLLGTASLRFAVGRWRPTIALAAVIPASLVASFACFYAWGVALDVVALSGLALAAGLLVDNSIVVVEAIESVRASAGTEAPVVGTSQVAGAVVAGTLTTGVVFLPLVYLQGLARAFFGVQAFAIVSALAVSLALSLTLTPVLAGRTGPATEGRMPGREIYRRWLAAASARPATVIVTSCLLVALGALTAARLPRELVPGGQVRELEVRYDLPPWSTAEHGRQLGEEVVAAVGAAVPGATSVRWTQWGERRELDAESGRVVVGLGSPERAAAATSALVAALARLPDVRATVSPRSSAFVEAIERAGQGAEIVITAPRAERVAELVSAVEARLAGGLHRLRSGGEGPQPTWWLRWDETRLARLGLDPRRLESQVAAALGGTAGRVAIPGVEPEIVVEAGPEARLPLVPVGGATADVVPLAGLARIEAGARPPMVRRLDGRPVAVLTLEATGRVDAEGLEAAIGGLAEGPDEAVRLGGRAVELARSFGQLRFALGLALVLVFLTVAAVYESFATPLVVMSTVPVAATGGLLLLAATGQSLNVMSLLGLILLVGLVVNNSIVLLHRADQRRAAGEEAGTALERAAAERFRPIVLTTVTTLAGMVPLALVAGEGVELRRALAVTVIGGLVTALAASLLLVPVLALRVAASKEAGGR